MGVIVVLVTGLVRVVLDAMRAGRDDLVQVRIAHAAIVH
jgi:hypothetical protein